MQKIYSSNELTIPGLGSCVHACYETVHGDLPLPQLLCSLCCIDKSLDADDNAIKTVNLGAKSLSDNCEL